MPSTRQFRIQRQYEPQHHTHRALALAYARVVPRTQRLLGRGADPPQPVSPRDDRGQQEGRSHA